MHVNSVVGDPLVLHVLYAGLCAGCVRVCVACVGACGYACGASEQGRPPSCDEWATF